VKGGGCGSSGIGVLGIPFEGFGGVALGSDGFSDRSGLSKFRIFLSCALYVCDVHKFELGFVSCLQCPRILEPMHMDTSSATSCS